MSLPTSVENKSKILMAKDNKVAIKSLDVTLLVSALNNFHREVDRHGVTYPIRVHHHPQRPTASSSSRGHQHVENYLFYDNRNKPLFVLCTRDNVTITTPSICGEIVPPTHSVVWTGHEAGDCIALFSLPRSLHDWSLLDEAEILVHISASSSL